uniref:Suppressor of forked domain-containing protein n=1 Tax=Parascaris equorum TaxID=6256 RepID=A0A914RGL1_PAREQ
MWRKYIQWEKTNPSGTEEYAHFARRVIFAYEQALLCLGYYPDIWYEASLFQQQAAVALAEKGDVKLAAQMNAEVAQLFERAIGGLLKDSQLLFFAYADFEEERMKYDNVRKIYDKLLAIEQADPTLVSFYLFRCNCFSNYSVKLLWNVLFSLQNTATHFIRFPLHYWENCWRESLEW